MTNDGNYLIVGQTDANALLVKLDVNGKLEWNRTYGGSGSDRFTSITKSKDGGFLVVGDNVMVKLNEEGNTRWTKNMDIIRYNGIVHQTNDGGYIIAGESDTDKTLIIRTNSIGNVIWDKKFYEGNNYFGFIKDAIQTNDNGYALTGDVYTGYELDLWILKLKAENDVDPPIMDIINPINGSTIRTNLTWLNVTTSENAICIFYGQGCPADEPSPPAECAELIQKNMFITNGTFHSEYITNLKNNFVYNITVNCTDNFGNSNKSSVMFYVKGIVNINSINLINTDFLNRTNGTLVANFDITIFGDLNITANETLWYINNILAPSFSNKTFIDPTYTTKHENWIVSARVFDGLNWSKWVNSSPIKILNSKSMFNITNFSNTVLETQIVNTSLNAFDLDNDNLTFKSNKSELIIMNNSLLWYTNLSDSGVYTINVTISDGEENNSVIINITVIDALDSDNDNNPDFTDPDDDNDGINDTEDMLLGNSSNIETSSIDTVVEIENSTNLSQNFFDDRIVKIKNINKTIVEFTYNFSNSTLDLRNISIDIQVNTTKGMAIVNIKGVPIIGTKTIYVDNVNNLTTLCIKDAEVTSITQISSLCNGANEYGIKCPGTANNDKYNCAFADETNTSFKITGLTHSGVQQQSYCGDGVVNSGETCSNCPADAGSCPSDSGGGGSSGGGGGGGGGAPGFVCNMDWKCGDWSECINGLQTRQCDFVKVPQHAQNEQCPEETKLPATTQTCESKEEVPIIKPTGEASAKSAQATPSKPANETTQAKKIGLGEITGAVLANPKAVRELEIGAIALIVIVTSGVIGYKFIYKKK